MSHEAATAADGGSAPPAGDEAGGYLGTISSLFTSLAADASASARGAEDRVLDSVEKSMESIESGAKHLRSSLAALSSAETRAHAMASLTRRADLASGDAPPQIAGASAYVATLERALDDYDVNNAHHVARAQRVSDAAQDLSTKLRGHAEAWRETDEALASLPECVARAWALDKDVAETCDLMSRTEMLLLEAEIAVEVDELYRRDEETRVVRRLAKSAHRGEVEKLEQFRRAMETEARDTQVTMKSAEEIALEEGLRRELRAIKKHARKQEKKAHAGGAAGETGSSRSFLPAPTKEDHYGLGVESDSGEDDVHWRPGGHEEKADDDDDEYAAPRRRATLAAAAADVDVATAVSRVPGVSELDDFLADDGDGDGDGDGETRATDKRAYYTVYGLRKQADESRAAIVARRQADANASAVAWLGSKSREAAEAIGLARKEALGLDDEDLIFVNLKPPPPSGGAGDDLLDEREAHGDGDASAASRDALNTAGGSGTYVNYEMLESATASSAAAAKEAYERAAETAAAAAAAAAAASAQAGSVFAGFGSSLASFGEAARRNAAASLEAAQGRAKEGAAWVNTSIGAAGDSWQRHLQGGVPGATGQTSEPDPAAEEEPAAAETPAGAESPADASEPPAEPASPVALVARSVDAPVDSTAVAVDSTGGGKEFIAERKEEAFVRDSTPVNAAPREAPSPPKATTPAAEREDRDEGFDEVMTKDATFGYWKDKDREAGSAEASPKPSPKPSPNKGKAATSPSP